MITKIREALKGKIVPILLITTLFLVIFVSRAMANTVDFQIWDLDYYYEANLDSTMIIGVMPGVTLRAIDSNNQPLAGVRICGRWYEDEQYANVPNGDWAQGPYCRTTFEDGSILFRYRERFDAWYDIDTWNPPTLTELAAYNISFRVLSMDLVGYEDITELDFIYMFAFPGLH